MGWMMLDRAPVFLRRTSACEARIERTFAHGVAPTEPCEETLKTESVAAMGGCTVSRRLLVIRILRFIRRGRGVVFLVLVQGGRSSNVITHFL